MPTTMASNHGNMVVILAAFIPATFLAVYTGIRLARFVSSWCYRRDSKRESARIEACTPTTPTIKPSPVTVDLEKPLPTQSKAQSRLSALRRLAPLPSAPNSRMTLLRPFSILLDKQDRTSKNLPTTNLDPYPQGNNWWHTADTVIGAHPSTLKTLRLSTHKPVSSSDVPKIWTGEPIQLRQLPSGGTRLHGNKTRTIRLDEAPRAPRTPFVKINSAESKVVRGPSHPRPAQRKPNLQYFVHNAEEKENVFSGRFAV